MRKIVVSLGLYGTTVGLLFVFLEWEQAMEELTLTSIALIALPTLVLAVFLWNLWLAPYRIVMDRLSALERPPQTPMGLIGNIPIGPLKFDAADYKEYQFPTLSEAACLWVEVHPHHPVTDVKATIKLGELKGAIVQGRLKIPTDTPLNALNRLSEALSGDYSKRVVNDNQRVGLVALRRYADRIGSVPKFLQDVEVPVEPTATKADKTEELGTHETPRQQDTDGAEGQG